MSDEEPPEELAGQSVFSFAALPECEAWFAEHSADHRGFWLKIGKMGAAETVTYAEALDVALCHGWIDGQKKGYDERSWLQRFTRRGPQSIWSKVNRAKAEALIAAGRMRPPGHARSTRPGRWPLGGGVCRPAQRYRARRLPCRPRGHPQANAFFKTLSGANRYAILYRIKMPRSPRRGPPHREVRRDVPPPRDFTTTGQRGPGRHPEVPVPQSRGSRHVVVRVS